MRPWLAGVFALFMACAALAQPMDLPTAKKLGLVGEKLNGLIGAVAQPADPAVQSFVDYINEGRLQHYQKLSRATGKPLTLVQAAAGRNLVQVTVPGEFIQNGQGQWVRRD